MRHQMAFEIAPDEAIISALTHNVLVRGRLQRVNEVASPRYFRSEVFRKAPDGRASSAEPVPCYRPEMTHRPHRSNPA